MNALKWSSQYVEGVKNFMKFVEEKMGSDCDFQCPCIDCLNVYRVKMWCINICLFEGLIDSTFNGFIMEK